MWSNQGPHIALHGSQVTSAKGEQPIRSGCTNDELLEVKLFFFSDICMEGIHILLKSLVT
jgi:hypothetical protein